MPAQEPIPKNEKNKGRLIPDILLTYTLVAILLICALCNAYLVVNPPHAEKFTEFYLLGRGGNADNYPIAMDLGDYDNVTVGVVNHEYRDMDYDLAVVLDDGIHKTKLYTQKISLADNDTYQNAITIKPNMNGTGMKLDFLLYADGDLTVPYRECYLYIDVDRPFYYDIGHLRTRYIRMDV
jgi:uncharacterized membrane protein